MNRQQRRAGRKKGGPISPSGPRLDIGILLAQATRFHQSGNVQEAARLYQQILQRDPGNARVLHLFGIAAHQLGRSDAAILLLRQAVEADRHHPGYHNDLGNILSELGRHAEAVTSFAEAVRHRPDYVEAHNNLGLAARAAGRPGEAEAAFVQALSHRPSFAEAHCNLGMMLFEGGRVAESLPCFLHAVALNPTLPEAHNGLGNALERRDDLDGAEISLRRALSHRPGYAEALHNLGIVLKEQARFTEAAACFEQALACRPDFAEARFALGLTLLQIGKWAEGWRNYDYRFAQTAEPGVRHRPFPQPAWSGEAGNGRTIFLWAEQGFGDALQFGRFARDVSRLGWRVVLEVHAELARLFASSLPEARVVPRGEALPPFDAHCPLLSVPRLLGITLDTLPAPPSYLAADREATQRWRAQLARGGGFKVGVAWRGSAGQKRNRRRSLRPEAFAEFLDLPGVDVISLQKDGRQEELTVLGPRGVLVDAGPKLGDFADTAALISALDLVISVDTSVLHLAGALGVPAWGLLDHASDWQWLTDRRDSPWYPSVRLFRQPRRGDWTSVTAEVRRELGGLLAERLSAAQAAG